MYSLGDLSLHHASFWIPHKMQRDFQNKNNPIWGFGGGGSLLSKNKNASTVHYVISACLRDSSTPGSKEV